MFNIWIHTSTFIWCYFVYILFVNLNLNQMQCFHLIVFTVTHKGSISATAQSAARWLRCHWDCGRTGSAKRKMQQVDNWHKLRRRQLRRPSVLLSARSQFTLNSTLHISLRSDPFKLILNLSITLLCDLLILKRSEILHDSRKPIRYVT